MQTIPKFHEFRKSLVIGFGVPESQQFQNSPRPPRIPKPHETNWWICGISKFQKASPQNFDFLNFVGVALYLYIYIYIYIYVCTHAYLFFAHTNAECLCIHIYRLGS